MDHKDYSEEDICPIDLYVKSRLVTDTVNLARKKRSTLDETDEFGCLSRLHPTDVADYENSEQDGLHGTILNLRKIFYTITPIKDKTKVTAQMFEKLMNKSVIKNTGAIQKVDLSLCFQSYCGVGGPRFIDFIGFCGLMVKFYNEKMVHQAGYEGSYDEFIEAVL